MKRNWLAMICWNIAPEGTPSGVGTPPPGDTPPPVIETPPPAEGQKWWEKLSDDHRAYLTPKGLTVDDPMEALPKLIGMAASAEKRIGKGVADWPAKDQTYGDWARANAEALGLPADAAGYEVKPPENWPKDLPWDAQSEAALRDVALKNGVTPAAHQAYVGHYAEMVLALDKAATDGLAQARSEMMTELQKDWGAQTQAKVTRASQAMQTLAESAGVSLEGIQALTQTMSEKTGDAGVMRIFDKVAEMLGDDTGIAMGRGAQNFGMTPAEARAELSRFNSPEGEYGKAFAEGNHAKMKELSARRTHLAKLAGG